MILGVGIDAVSIAEMRQIIETSGTVFLTHTFSVRELQTSPKTAAEQAEYLSGCFAVKEAVFKALARHTPEKGFDFRCVETAHRRDGSPYVVPNDQLTPLLQEAGVGNLQISITNEGGLAIAIAIAESCVHDA